MTRPRGLLIAITLLVVVGTVWASLHRDPWDPDETRYLQVTRELIDGRNPFFLRFNGEAYSDKPPLFFWLLAPLVFLIGAESALPGALLALAAWLALGAVSGRLARAAGLDPGVIRWAPVLAMSTFLPAVLAGGCRMDLVFAVLCGLALEQVVRLAASPAGDPRAHLMLWVWIALGILTKGPLALVFPVLGLLLLGRSAWPTLRRAVAGWGPVVAVAIIAAWLVPATITGGRHWLETILIHQSAGRAVASFAHQEPWWYHLATVPISLLPWSPAVLLATVAAFGQRHVLPEPARVMAAYPVAGIIFLSLLSGKTFLYPLPLLVPAGVVAAWWLCRSPRSRPRSVALAAGGGVFALIAAGLALVVAPRPDMNLDTVATMLTAGSLAAPALAAVVFAVMGRSSASAAALALAVPLFAAVGIQPLVGAFDRLLSLRPFAAAYSAAAPAQDRPGLAFGKIQPGFVLFTDRSFELLTSAEELAAALERGEAVAIDAKAVERLHRESTVRWSETARIPYRHSEIVVIKRPDRDSL